MGNDCKHTLAETVHEASLTGPLSRWCPSCGSLAYGATWRTPTVDARRMRDLSTEREIELIGKRDDAVREREAYKAAWGAAVFECKRLEERYVGAQRTLATVVRASGERDLPNLEALAAALEREQMLNRLAVGVASDVERMQGAARRVLDLYAGVSTDEKAEKPLAVK